jgi:TolB protein
VIKGSLFLLDISTGHVRQLTSDGSDNLEAEWSPEGGRIAFQSTRDGRSDLYIMNFGSGEVRWLTGGAGFNELPRWSPDGSWISFNSSRDGTHGPLGIAGFHRNVYLIKPDGSGLRRLTDGGGFNGDAVWSPKGDLLAFTSDRGGAFDIYLLGTDGRVVRQLTRHTAGGFASYASWSPDGSRLVFDASNPQGDAARASLYWLPVEGGDPRRLTPSLDFRPNWSHNGEWIAFVGSRNGHTQIFTVRPDGSDLTQLTSDPTDKDWPRWRPA